MRHFFILFIACSIAGCFEQRNRLPDPVIVEAPVSVPRKADPNDSTYLMIKLEQKGITISLFNDSLSASDIKTIDQFISANENKIDKNKILVIGLSAVPIERFYELKAVLKKHELYKLSLVTESVDTKNP